MASALDKNLIDYRSRPRDMSGQKKAKVSLIFDPTVAASTSAGTFYQVGYAGFTELLQIDHRIKKFEKSIFEPSLTDVDPLFMTADEFNPLREKVRKLLFFLSNYCMDVCTVKILEYLIQQFAINRLNPDILIFIALPYLETPLFVRIIQTIPFKAIPKTFDFLDNFRFIASTKKPIDRSTLISWIFAKPQILSWIIGMAPNVGKYHPDGVYSSFMGVLLSEIALKSNNEVINENIVNAASAALDDPSGYLAPQYMMAILSMNESKELSILPKFTKKISSNAEAIFSKHFEQMFAITVALFQKSVPIHAKEGFVHAVASRISTVKDFIRNTDTTVMAKSFSNLIVKKSKNEALVKSAIAILETSFFEGVAKDFLLEFVKNFPGGEYAEMLVQKLANDYPEVLTEEVNEALKAAGISVRLSAHTRQSIIDSLTESSKAAAVFADPEQAASVLAEPEQAIICLQSAEAANSTEVVEPLIKFYRGKFPERVLQYICEHLFLSGTEFSTALVQNVTKYSKEIAPYLDGIKAKSNKAIIDFLVSKSDELPNFKALPLAAAKALHTKAPEDVTNLIRFLPQRKLNYEVVRQQEKEIYDAKLEFVAENAENQAAFILAVVHKIADEIDLAAESLLALFSFPDFRCLLPIVVKLASKNLLTTMTSVFHIASNNDKNARMNVLTLIAIVLPMANPYDIIPTLFCALLNNEFTERSIDLIRGLPLKEANIKDVVPHINKQASLFGKDERTTRDVFFKSASNPKTRDFYNHCWEHIHDASTALDFFNLTHDEGAISAIKNLEKDPKIVELFDAYISVYTENEDAKDWALNTLNSGIIRAAMPYLNETKLNKALPFVCAYPQFYAIAFSRFFKTHNIPTKDIEREITKGQTSAVKESKTDIPPVVFQNKNFAGLMKSLASRVVISPCTILLENIAGKQNIEGIVDLVPSIVSLFDMEENSRVIPLIFNCLLLALKKDEDKKSTDIMIENFPKIISAISSTTVPHIHSTALAVVEELAKVKPEEVAKHAKTLFSAMSTETLFSDDIANLTRINQLLSSVLPILERANTIMELLNFFSENIDRFSMDRASKIMIHSIGCLNSESYRVFDSLLKHDKVDFALMLTDQMKPETLMSSIIRLTELTEANEQYVAFIKQIQFPSLPTPMIRFFMVLQKKLDEDDFSQFVSEVCDSWALPDFISFSEEAVAKQPLTTLIQRLTMSRIEEEPSSIYANLLKPLQSLIEHCTELQSTLNTLKQITPLLEDEHAHSVSTIITKTLETVSNNDVLPSVSLTALSFCAYAVEHFKMSILEVYPPVLDFAADFLHLVVENEAQDALATTVGAVCLLLSASPEFAADKLVKIIPPLLSRVVLSTEKLYELVIKNLGGLVTALTLDQVLPSFVATLEVKTPAPESLIAMFELMSESLKHSDVHMVRRLQVTLLKFFLLAFTIRFDDRDDNSSFQESAAAAFGEYANRLNEQLFAISFTTILQYMLTLSDKKQKDYVVGRVFFARVILAIVDTLKEVFAKFYSNFFDSFIQFVLETDDGVAEQRDVTLQVMQVITKICDYADQVFFESRFSKILEAIKIHLVFFDGEKKHDTTVDGNEDDEDNYEYKVTVVGTAFAALMGAAKTNTTQMMNVLLELLRHQNPIVSINMFNVLLICNDSVRDVFAGVVSSALPAINELLESPDADIQAAARTTVFQLSRTNESVRKFFDMSEQ